MSSLRFCLFDHQHKGQRLARSLFDAGWTHTGSVRAADLFLVDHDGWFAHPRPSLIAAAHESGTKIVLYPHGAHPTVTFYDGAFDPDPRVDMRLEHGFGSIVVAQKCGIKGLKQKAVGWTYTDTKPFKPAVRPASILFAPLHPNGDGDIHSYDVQANRQAYEALLKIPDTKLFVRTLGPPLLSGLWETDKVEFRPARSMSVLEACQEVDQHDAVVAAGTIGFLAVARGKPTVMLEDRNIERGVIPNHAKQIDAYVRYPYTFWGQNLAPLLAEAGRHEATGWRNRFIGEPTDFAATLESLVAN